MSTARVKNENNFTLHSPYIFMVEEPGELTPFIYEL
jgi:hypothetical protein